MDRYTCLTLKPRWLTECTLPSRSVAENERALTVSDRLMSKGEDNLAFAKGPRIVWQEQVAHFIFGAWLSGQSIGRPIGDRFGTDPNLQASPFFERGVILAPVADSVRGFLFHCKKNIPRHLIRNSSLRFVQQSPLRIVFPRSAAPTRSWCWKVGRLLSAAHTINYLPRAGVTNSFTINSTNSRAINSLIRVRRLCLYRQK